MSFLFERDAHHPTELAERMGVRELGAVTIALEHDQLRVVCMPQDAIADVDQPVDAAEVLTRDGANFGAVRPAGARERQIERDDAQR
jgi:hypothetical protein